MHEVELSPKFWRAPCEPDVTEARLFWAHPIPSRIRLKGTVMPGLSQAESKTFDNPAGEQSLARSFQLESHHYLVGAFVTDKLNLVNLFGWRSRWLLESSCIILTQSHFITVSRSFKDNANSKKLLLSSACNTQGRSWQQITDDNRHCPKSNEYLLC